MSVCKVIYCSGLEAESCLQVANKAFFVLSSQLDPQYFIELTLCGSEIQVLMFMRGGSAVTTPIDIRKDPIDFMYILAVFALANLSWLGYDEIILIGEGDTLLLSYRGVGRSTHRDNPCGSRVWVCMGSGTGSHTMHT